MCPPTLRDNLDAFLGHLFLTSGGTRYVPWFGPEVLLVETFPESKPNAATPLLTALGLERRLGVPRLAIEHAVLAHGPDICLSLGLDPMEFVVTCIPFDAYLRLAPQWGWGAQERWTHFDGYQVTRQLHFWALVGGNARYGGPHDVASVARTYDSERLTARFAIVRRRRFRVREAQGELPLPVQEAPHS